MHLNADHRHENAQLLADCTKAKPLIFVIYLLNSKCVYRALKPRTAFVQPSEPVREPDGYSSHVVRLNRAFSHDKCLKYHSF